ncbi:MAG: ribonuclease Z [Gemmatimonadales bacterium]|nr:MAG: ribonuclease Z [Gemmatimonadales bacterium]
MSVPVRVTILGSGVLLPDDTRRSAAHLVEGADFSLLMDCGSGALHGMDRFQKPWRGLTHLAITHFHTDHFGDLAPLLWALHHGIPGGRDEPLVLLGPPGFNRILGALAAAHGDFVLAPGFPLEIVELERNGRWDDPRGRFALRTHPARHTPEAVALRLEVEGVRPHDGLSIGYTGDTGPDLDLGAFFQGVGLLVAECAVADPTELEIHLSPRSAAALAQVAEPALLVLTHLYPELDPDRLPDLLAREGYTGRVLTGRDGLTLTVGPGRVEVPPGDASTPNQN